MINFPFLPTAALLAGGVSGWTIVSAIPAVVASVVAFLTWHQSKMRDERSASAVDRQADLTQITAAFEMQKSIAEQANARADRADKRAKDLEGEVEELRSKLDEQIALNKAYRQEFDQYRYESLVRQDEMRHEITAAQEAMRAMQAQIVALQGAPKSSSPANPV